MPASVICSDWPMLWRRWAPLEHRPYDETSDGANQTLVSFSVLEYPLGSDVPQIYDYTVPAVRLASQSMVPSWQASSTCQEVSDG